jgi:peptide/nickel transport system permease protein
MYRYLAKRLLQLIPLLLGISLVAFMIVHLAPGGPLAAVGGDASPEMIDKITEEYGLNQPLYIQYGKWITHVVSGDFGNSFVQHRPVSEMIAERLPNTIRLNVVTIVLAYLIALPLGVVSAVRRYTWIDNVATVTAFVGLAMPSFWLAFLLVYAFALPLGWPMSGISTYGIDLTTYGWLSVVGDRLKYMLLPTVVLVTASLANITRYMRASMLDVLNEDFVRTAKAKGLADRVVIYKHALRNALLPVITLAGYILPHLFSGTVIVEQIFSWPGVGLLAYRAVLERDYPVIMAFNTIGACLTVVSFLIVDLAYLWADPRIKYE